MFSQNSICGKYGVCSLDSAIIQKFTEVYMIFVFIGGQSASGKTGVSLHLLKKLLDLGVNAQTLNMDDYYHERPDNIAPELFRKITNFDTPKMLDLELLTQHVNDLNQGKSITKPLFAFTTNRRQGRETISPSEVIIIEGIFAQYFYKKYLSTKLPAVIVNVATDRYLDIVDRRIKRDMAHRGRRKEDVIKQEHQYVGPGFLKYTASNATGADVYISNGHKDTESEQNLALDNAADEIIAEIKRKQMEIHTGNVQPRRSTPKAQDLVAKSHQKAKTATYSHKFNSYFNSVFGDFSGPIGKTELIEDLTKYINRINQHKENNTTKPDFKHGFWVCKKPRALNRKANFYLAQKLLNDLNNYPEKSIHELFKDIGKQRDEIIKANKINDQPDYIARGIHSDELNSIIDKAKKFDPPPSSSPSFNL